MIYEFDIFELDTEIRELRTSDGPVSIPPKAFSALQFLLENADRMVPKSELMDEFWPSNATEASLQTTLSVIRKMLRNAGGNPAVFKTMHGQGVRFTAEIKSKEGKGSGPVVTAQRVEEQRNVAVLSLRIKASGTAEPSQSDLAKTLGIIAETAESLVETHQGQLLHMMVDGFTAVFGLGPMQEDAGRRAAATAFDLNTGPWIDVLTKLGTGLAIGLDCGSVAMSETRLASVWTPPSELERRAVSLSQAARINEVLAGETAIAHLRDQVDWAERPDGFRILTAPPDRSGVPAPTSQASRFVGRSAEMAFLSASANGLKNGIGQAIMLSGPAGIGKSRLIREFLDETELTVLTVNCLPRLSNTPLAPIRDLVMKLPPPDALDNPTDTALLKRILGAPASEALAGMSDVTLQSRSCAVLQSLLASACAVAPVIVVFEDVHWIDGSSRAHLEALIRLTETTPLLILLSTRPTGQPDLTQAALHLAPLGIPDCLKVLQAIPEMDRVEIKDLKTLADRASGNPFFLEELAMSHLAGATTLPGTVLAVVENRISQLEGKLRNLLYCVVTIGPPAPVALIAHLMTDEVEEIRPDLIRLERLGFLREEPEGVVCRHMLLSDAAYEMIAPVDRIRLHGEIATYLLSAAETSPVRSELLALHLQEAGETTPAVQHWTRASNAALSRAAAQEAITFAQNGLDLLESTQTDNPGLEMGLHLSMAPALMAARGYGAAEAGAAFRHAFRLNQQLGVAKVQPRILLGLWLHSWVAGDLADSVSHAKALDLIARGANHPSLSLQAGAALGSVLTHMGEFRPAREKLLTGLGALGDEKPDTITTQNSAVTCASYAAWTAALLGDATQVEVHGQQAAAFSQALVNPFAEAIYLSLISEACLLIGDFDQSEALALQACDLSETHNYPFWLGTGLVLQGAVKTHQKDPTTALTLIDRGLNVFQATGAGVQLANWFGLKAEALIAADLPTEAREVARNALSHATKTGDIWFSDRIHAALSQAHEMLGDSEQAAQHAQKSKELATFFRGPPRN